VHGAGPTADGTAYDRDGVAITPTPSAAYSGAVYLGTGLPGNDPITFTPVPLPAAWGDDVTIKLSTTGATPKQGLRLARHVAAPPATIEVTVATDFLPRIAASVTGAWPRPSVTWTASAAIADADLVTVVAGGWWIFAPATAGTVAFPALPAGMAPAGATTLTAVEVFQSSTVAGYDAARADVRAAYQASEHRTSSFGAFVDP
jgi:hypothetical protein